jgi:hypothetical protein
MAITSEQVKEWTRGMDLQRAANVLGQLEGKKASGSNYSNNSKGSRGGRARHTPGVMNDLEKRFSEYLELHKKLKGSELFGCHVEFEAMRFRLGYKCFYTPDFVVYSPGIGLRVYEVKGFWEDDARVKIKTVAARYRWIKFIAVTEYAGAWRFEEIIGC